MNTTQGTGKGIEEDKLVSKVTAFWKETLDRREGGGGCDCDYRMSFFSKHFVI